MASTARLNPLSPLSPHDSGTSIPSHYSSGSNTTPTTNTFSLAGTSFSNSTMSDSSNPPPTWKYRQPASTSQSYQVPRLAKIKSSPSQGPLAAARQTSTTGKLHKRAGSTSAVQKSPTFPSPSFGPQLRSDSMNHASDSSPSIDEAYTITSSPVLSTPRSKAKIKPFLKKLTSQEDNSLDLNRSAADLEGLGIYSTGYNSPFRPGTEATFTNATKRGVSHNRSTSGLSQFSTATTASGSRQYVHPMRQTPRPYTPPIGQSYQNSVLGSEYSGDGAGVGSEHEEQIRQIVRDASYRGPPQTTSSEPPPQPLRIQTNLSATRLIGASQTNLASASSPFQSRIDAMSPSEAASPSSRPSLDRSFKMRTRTISDPASRAASIRAARQAFSEKEAAKADKIEKDEQRAMERENRRRQKREDAQRRKSEASDRTRSRTPLSNEKLEVVAGREYSSLTPVHSHPTATAGIGPRTHNGPSNRVPPGGRHEAQSAWMGFMLWLRTRFFKLGKKISGRQ